ncbi:MAG: hypothetical protein QOE61_5400, partial [Micromonosporaceae bacterium]|nr:hypothetical protein [Micromonosporaceae bacterium]
QHEYASVLRGLGYQPFCPAPSHLAFGPAYLHHAGARETRVRGDHLHRLAGTVTVAITGKGCSRSSSRWEATLTSVPFSARCATDTMNRDADRPPDREVRDLEGHGSATGATLHQVQAVLPLRGLRPTASAWGSCGQLSPVPSTRDYSLPAGATAWLTITFDVLIPCPGSLPVLFTLNYTQSGRAGIADLRGFPDLGDVPLHQHKVPRRFLLAAVADGTKHRVAQLFGLRDHLVDWVRDQAARAGVDERRFDRGVPRVNLRLPDGCWADRSSNTWEDRSAERLDGYAARSVRRLSKRSSRGRRIALGCIRFDYDKRPAMSAGRLSLLILPPVRPRTGRRCRPRVGHPGRPSRTRHSACRRGGTAPPCRRARRARTGRYLPRRTRPA